jgi:hypothetical protein
MIMTAFSAQPSYDRRPTGRNLLAAAWSLLRSNGSLLVLPVLSAICATLAALLVGLPGMLLVIPADGKELSGAVFVASVVVLWLAFFVATAVSVFFQVALLAAVFAHLDGRQVSVGTAIGLATRRLGAVLAWSALTATIGTLLRMLEERGILGAIAATVMSIGWAIASFFVVPIIAAEGIGPGAALKRSAQLFRATWGPSARATLRFGLVYFLVLLPAFVVLGLVIVTIGHTSAVELGLMALAVVYLVVAGIVLTALGVVVRGVLYRYAAGLPVPGVDPAALSGALR